MSYHAFEHDYDGESLIVEGEYNKPERDSETGLYIFQASFTINKIEWQGTDVTNLLQNNADLWQELEERGVESW